MISFVFLISILQDVENLIARLRSGISPPGNLTFEDLTALHTTFIEAADSNIGRCSIGAIYTSGSAVLPSNFCNSNDVGDYGGSESSGFVDPVTGGPIYAGTGSVYSALSSSRLIPRSGRPSVSAASGSASPTSHGSALLRRIFSRRSRVSPLFFHLDLVICDSILFSTFGHFPILIIS